MNDDSQLEIGDDVFGTSGDLPSSTRWSPLDVLVPGSPTLHFRSERLEEFPWEVGQQIFDILKDFLQQSTDISASTAAARVNALFFEKRREDDEEDPPGGFLLELWDIVLNLAEQIPFDNPAMEKLVDFMRKLVEIPSSSVEVRGREFKLWVDLPVLVESIHSEISTIESCLIRPESRDASRIARWHSFNSFIARLTGEGLCSTPLYALWTLRDTIEHGEYPHSKWYQREIQALDIGLPVAFTWFKHAGKVLFELDVEYDGEAGRGGYLWDGKKGFCPERWALWKRRFGEIFKLELASEEARDIAMKGFKVMQEIEDSCSTAVAERVEEKEVSIGDQ